MTELTNEYIDSLIDKAQKNMYIEPNLKAMMVTAIFPCGWVISSTANVVSGQEFVEEELRDKCLDDIKSKVWELETYRKTIDNYKKTLKQEKIVETKVDDKPLGYQEAMEIYKKICNNTAECINCLLSSDNNGTQISCQDFLRNCPGKAEPILKKWLAEHPIKTNEQKINEMFLETFGISYATALAHPDWWQQEYKNIDNKIHKRRMNNEEIN